jgi:hypothetical protein
LTAFEFAFATDALAHVRHGGKRHGACWACRYGCCHGVCAVKHQYYEKTVAALNNVR